MLKVVLRNTLAVLVGLIVGGLVNWAFLLLNNMVFPLPEGTDMNDPAQMKEVIASMPGAAWIGVFAAHLGQAFVGGWVAAKLGVSRPVLLAMIVGVLSLAGGILNAIMLETPSWTWIEMPLYLLVAWYAGRLVEKGREAGGASS